MLNATRCDPAVDGKPPAGRPDPGWDAPRGVARQWLHCMPLALCGQRWLVCYQLCDQPLATSCVVGRWLVCSQLCGRKVAGLPPVVWPEGGWIVTSCVPVAGWWMDCHLLCACGRVVAGLTPAKRPDCGWYATRSDCACSMCHYVCGSYATVGEWPV